MRHLPASGYRVMPWKNGGGTTTEILVAGADPVHYDWRVSIATVAGDGPFSIFAGYDRHIMTIEGSGMVLEGGPAGPIDVSPAFVPRSFSGDWSVTGRLHRGSSRDFNLIVRRSDFDSDLAVIEVPTAARLHASGSWLLACVLTGEAIAADMRLTTHDSLDLDPGEQAEIRSLTGPLRLAVCRVRRRASP